MDTGIIYNILSFIGGIIITLTVQYFILWFKDLLFPKKPTIWDKIRVGDMIEFEYGKTTLKGRVEAIKLGRNKNYVLQVRCKGATYDINYENSNWRKI